MLVGAYGYSEVFLYLGAADGVDTTSDATLSGEEAGEAFGWSVSGAGDVNGDGYADVVVGAYEDSSSTGRAYVFLGDSSGVSTTADATLTGEAGAGLGYDVADAGDVNGDGFADILVSTSTTGEVRVYEGSTDGIADATCTTLMGDPSKGFGLSVAGAGDVDADGYDDILIGASDVYPDPGSNYAGAAYVYRGSPTGPADPAEIFTGETYAHIGYSVSGAGDVNGDGYDDVLVGSLLGEAYVYEGNADDTPGADDTGISEGCSDGADTVDTGDSGDSGDSVDATDSADSDRASDTAAKGGSTGCSGGGCASSGSGTGGEGLGVLVGLSLLLRRRGGRRG